LTVTDWLGSTGLSEDIDLILKIHRAKKTSGPNTFAFSYVGLYFMVYGQIL